MSHSGRSKTGVASRPSRHVAVQEGQRWNNLHPDCDRCVFPTSFVRSAKEQVSSFVGIAAFTQLLGNTLRRTTKKRRRALFCKRFNRTLNTRMWRYLTKHQSVQYVDVLQAFMRSYNDTYHRSIGMAPSEVTNTNQQTVWQRLCGHETVGTPKFRVGDRVRISRAKRHFEKGYMANWTEELFTIVDAHRSDAPV